MGDESQTKICPLCAETIKAAAKVCPYCQASQKRFALWRKDSLPLLSAVLFTAFLGAVCIWVFPDDVASTGPSFPRHREDLQVLRTSLERSKKKPEYWLTGYVTNSGGRAPYGCFRGVCCPTPRRCCFPGRTGRTGFHQQRCCPPGTRAIRH